MFDFLAWLRWWLRRLRFVTLKLKAKRGWHLNLTVVLGSTVSGRILGHSAINGAQIPEGANVELASNDPSVATVPATITVPPGWSASLDFPITVLAVGATDFHVVVTTPDGDFEDTATLTVTPLPLPGLVRVEMVLTSP